jgi:hypothetical protein
MSEPLLNEAAKRFTVAYTAALDEGVTLILAIQQTGQARDSSRLEEMGTALMKHAINLRLAAEDFIYMTSRSKKVLEATFAIEPFPENKRLIPQKPATT